MSSQVIPSNILTGDIQARNVASSGTLSTTALTATSAAVSGAVSAASLAATGAVTAASLAATGAVTAASLTATGNVTAAGLTSSGAANISGSVVAGPLGIPFRMARVAGTLPAANASATVAYPTGVTAASVLKSSLMVTSGGNVYPSYDAATDPALVYTANNISISVPAASTYGNAAYALTLIYSA